MRTITVGDTLKNGMDSYRVIGRNDNRVKLDRFGGEVISRKVFSEINGNEYVLIDNHAFYPQR